MAKEEDQKSTTGARSAKLSKAEQRVVDRLRRARYVAEVAAPDLKPRLEDIIEIAEMLEDEGG